MLDQGVWAEVRVGDEHLRLFAEHNALGVQASVYNVIAKTWIAPSEPVDDLEQGRCELQLMPRNTSNVSGIWNCRLCDGRNRGPHSLDPSAAHFFKRPTMIRIVDDDATVCESFDGMAYIARDDRDQNCWRVMTEQVSKKQSSMKAGRKVASSAVA